VHQPNEEGDHAPLEAPRPLTPVAGASMSYVPWPRRLPGWLLPAVVAVLTLALVGTGTWGFVTANDLSGARKTIDEQNQRIAGLQTDLAQQTTRSDGLAASVANLQARVKNQDACISALATDATTLSQIAEKQGEIHNLTAKGSTWATATLARNAAVTAALSDYYNAYSAAFDGMYGSANTWISRGNAQIGEASRQLATMNTEIAKANLLLDEVDSMLKGYEASSNLSICSVPSTGSTS
jgi:hypothetical protein